MRVKVVESIPMSEREAAMVAAGFRAIAAQRDRLTAKGILDDAGNVVPRELPPDMRDGSKTEV